MTRSLVVRSLVLGLILSAAAFSSTRYSYASPAPDGVRGRAVFRLEGGTLFRGGNTDGAGWLAGGAVGFGVARDLLVIASIEHIAVRISDPYTESFQPMTIQLEMGAPFQHRITPRVDVGAGIYLRARDHFAPSYYYYDPHGLGLSTAPFGMTFGAGLSFLVAPTVMLDVGVRRHESFDSNESWGMTSAGAGLTFAFGGEERGSGMWTRSDRDAAAYASR